MDSRREVDEVRELLGIAREYAVALRIEMKRKEHKEDPVRAAELAADGVRRLQRMGLWERRRQYQRDGVARARALLYSGGAVAALHNQPSGAVRGARGAAARRWRLPPARWPPLGQDSL